MTAWPTEERRLTSAILDALTSQICILDSSSVIQFVNQAWQRFAMENGAVSQHSDVGCSYLDICRVASGPGSGEAQAFYQGVRDVLQGRSELFRMEYPCHSPTEDRWFVGLVTPLKTELKGAVVSHANITDRKRVELELAKLAATDSLTDLPNRRFFLDIANREMERIQRFRLPASVIMIDIDYFKSINDSYGHAAGDEVLRQVATTLREDLRNVDVVARLGGEEFVMLLPGTSEAGARNLAERLRVRLSTSNVSVGEHTFRVTASLGVTELSFQDVDIAAGLKRADAALYAAKRAGRNQVMTSTVGQREPEDFGKSWSKDQGPN